MSEQQAPIVDAAPAPIDPEEILAVRRGPGANCSSIGSTLDVLFLSATVAGMILVSAAAALGEARSSRDRAASAGPAGEGEGEGDDAGAG